MDQVIDIRRGQDKVSRLILPLSWIICISLCGCNSDIDDTLLLEYGGIGTSYFPKFQRSLFCSFANFPSGYAIQSSAVIGKYWFGCGYECMEDGNYTNDHPFIIVCNLEKGEYITTLPLKAPGVRVPHCNVCCFGNEMLDDSPFPPLYISQWNYNGERGVVVVKILNHNETFTCETIQTIIPIIGDKERFGCGSTDWIVDTDQNYLYSLAYYKPGSSTIVEGNKECICVFDLPKIADGPIIYLTDEDIVDSFDLEMINFSQDKCYYNGLIYVSSGFHAYPDWTMIRTINLNTKEVESVLNLSEWSGEPQGLAIYKDDILMNYGSRKQFLIHIIK
ncbi:MAG: hypothetical protein HDT06_02715 [Bacteroidales bacterium]|nr:hypothetical protein [Bacteroidales bacterium]